MPTYRRVAQRLLTENFGWKLLSLALAFVLWIAAVGEPDRTASVSAPVQFRNMPKELEISSDVPDSVRLDLEGPSGQLRSFGSGQAAVLLDLSSVRRPGERTFPSDQWQLDLPAGVQLLRAVPGQVRLRFEARQALSVPVQVRFSGKLPNGLRLQSYEARPARVQVVGPQSRVTEVDAAQTDEVDLTAVTESTEVTVPVFVEQPQVRLARDSRVTVRVTVARER